MFLYGVVLFFAKLYSAAPTSLVSVVFNGYISMFAVIFVAVQVIEDENDIKYILKAFMIAALVQCIYMISVYGTNVFEVISNSDDAIRVGDEVSNSNSVGISFAYGAVVSFYFIQTWNSFLQVDGRNYVITNMI